MSDDSRLAGVLRRVLPDAVRERYLAKFALALVVLALLTGALGLYTYDRTSAQLHEQVDDELLTVAELEAHQLSSWYAERKQTARMLSNDAVMRTDDYERLDILLNAKLRSLPEEVRAIHVVDTESAEVVQSTESEMQDSRLQTPWRDRMSSIETAATVFVSAPYRSDGEATIAFVSPVLNQQNRTVVLEVDAGIVSNHLLKPLQRQLRAGRQRQRDRRPRPARGAHPRHVHRRLASPRTGSKGALGDREGRRE
ncbi:PDC sensor domain-containing protein [Halorussus caseinilyticus]|uniref:PDC sensor domain-containing protein n=1 Tax=Halorussus caseinilyticus TaxID=3034025 RepID=A0ABD5WNS7_9EURY